MKKAERIYEATKRGCRLRIKDCGYEINPDGTAYGFNTTFHRDDECICTRTLNEMVKLLEADRRRIDFNKRHGFWEEEKDSIKEQTLNMVETTIKNARNSINC